MSVAAVAKRGFTLIEIMLAVTLSMVLIGSTAAAFMQLFKMINRVEVKSDLHRRAETIFFQANIRLATMAQHAAMVIDPRDAMIAGISQPALRFAYLRAKETQNDWVAGREGWDDDNSDTYWELWEYRPSEKRLYQANSTRSWNFMAIGSPAASPLNLNSMQFVNFPQARRTLAPANWMASLDDNQLFPQLPRTTPVSTSHVSRDDLGDWGMLQRNLRPIAEGMSELTIETVSQDGTVQTFTPGSAASPWVVDGVWMDGRATDATGKKAGTTGWSYATSGIAKRPTMLRLRFTLMDDATRISQVYSFSFALPGAARM